MKHIFIVNPAAGKENATDTVEQAVKNLGIDYEIYVTKSAGDAKRYVADLNGKSERYRVYACGGDGTLNEVVSGAVGSDNIAVTAFPVGSGNDFVKYYGPVEAFKNVEALVNGRETQIDVMRVGDRYAVNMVHFGLDTAVLRTMLKVRRHPVFGGKRAYTTGVVTAFVNGMKHRCIVTVDGKQIGMNKMLLCTIANGKYVGGKYKCAPRSDNTDGLMEICHVGTVSRLNFLRLMSAYENGTHLEDPRLERYISYARGSSVRVDALPGKRIAYSLDGELYFAESFVVENLKKAVKFIVPTTVGVTEISEYGKEDLTDVH